MTSRFNTPRTSSIASSGRCGSKTTTYVHGIGVDEMLGYQTTTWSSYSEDALASVTRLTDSVGVTLSTYRYDAFGVVRGQTGPGNAYGYASRENDGSIMYYRSRYYDQSAGRFTTSDPIGLCGGYNRYAYVGNNPASRSDPSGRMRTTMGGGGGGRGTMSTEYIPTIGMPGVDWTCVAGKVGEDCACMLALAYGTLHPEQAMDALDVCTSFLRGEPSVCDICGIFCGGTIVTKNWVPGVLCPGCLLLELAVAINGCQTESYFLGSPPSAGGGVARFLPF